MMVIWLKAVTGHRKYEGILLICLMRFPVSKIRASMKMNGSITNSSRTSTNSRLCFKTGFLLQIKLNYLRKHCNFHHKTL